MKKSFKKIVFWKNGSTICAVCKTPCQGFKDPSGRILCSDCYKKIWG